MLNNHIQKLIKFYKLAVEQDSTTALDFLAEIYENGLGVNKSQEIATHYRAKKFNLIKEVADSGDAVAQSSIGWHYENGVGVDVNLERAIKYYNLSADQNNPIAQYALAELFYKGKGVSKSLDQAFMFYQKATDNGYILAQVFFAFALLKENIHLEKAVDYLKLALHDGSSIALNLADIVQYELAVCYECGLGIKKSNSNALLYYKLSSDNGYQFAQNRLGNAYQQGHLGLAKSYEKAFYYHNLAAQQDDGASLLAIGQLYEKGLGVDQSFENAFQSYKKAAEINDQAYSIIGEYELARCYEMGIGTNKSIEMALHWYELSASNGNRTALYKAESCNKVLRKQREESNNR